MGGGCSVRSGDTSPTCIQQRSVSMSTSAGSVDRKFFPLRTWSMATGILLGTKKRRKSQCVPVERRRKQSRRSEVERKQDHLLKDISMRNTKTGNAGSAR